MRGEPIEAGPPSQGGAGRGGGLRDPGGPLEGVLSWAAIALVVGFIFLGHNLKERDLHRLAPGVFPAPASAPMAEVPQPDIQFLLLGRYMTGVGQLLRVAEEEPAPEGGEAPASQAQGVASGLLEQVDAAVGEDPAKALRAAVIAGELAGPSAALDRIEQAEDLLLEMSRDEQSNGDDAPADDAAAPAGPKYAPEAAAALRDDAESLRQVFSAGGESLPPDRRDALIARHGWFGRVASTHGMDPSAPARKAVMGKATRTMAALIGALIIAAVALLVGFALFIVAVVMKTSGRLRPRYRAPAPGGSVFLEAFALFLLGFVALSLVSEAIAQGGGPDLSMALVWLLPLLPLWALFRGVRGRAWRSALGWHTGSGALREVGAGVVGYLAGLPVALAGILLTALLLMIAQGMTPPGEAPVQPTHPVMEQISKGSVPAILGVYLLACVWAPLTEETFFRGALYHHLRGRMAGVGAGLTTAFIFAAIHPQGWVAIPALGSLGFVFAMLREWRGSLIAPMTAHAINNGFVMTMLVLAVG